jgi:hypothetical protein
MSKIAPCVALGYAAYAGVAMGIATFGPTFLQGLQYYEKETGAAFAFGTHRPPPCLLPQS